MFVLNKTGYDALSESCAYLRAALELDRALAEFSAKHIGHELHNNDGVDALVGQLFNDDLVARIAQYW